MLLFGEILLPSISLLFVANNISESSGNVFFWYSIFAATVTYQGQRKLIRSWSQVLFCVEV